MAKGKRLLARPGLSWLDKLKMDLGELGLVWLRIGTGALVNAVMNFRVS
jgi:hypothetical protein